MVFVTRELRKCLLFIGFLFISYASMADQVLQLPIDSSIRTGQLANRLTYYIRSTPVSPGRGCFYLVQNVGSLLENDHQNGLAHFLEHMAFKGSKHFPGRSMVDMLERKGLTYGKEISAYTSLNETLYGLNQVPLEGGMADSCLLVLSDWAHQLTLDSMAVMGERPVILAEWRTRRDAIFRLKGKTEPQLYAGSRYAVRDIIGDTAIVRSVNTSDLQQFYNTWYRPDLQAVVVVGDFNPLEMEKKIVALFSNIPLKKELPVRPLIEIPLDRKSVFVQATDSEESRSRLEIRLIQRADADNLEVSDPHLRLRIELFNRLIRERMYESFRANNVPAMGVAVLRTSEQRGYNTLAFVLLSRSGYEEKVLEAAWVEKERVKRFGFTEGELGRVKSMLLREVEAACQGYEKQPAEVWVEKLSRHFLDGIPLDDSHAYLAFVRRELENITSEELIACLKRWEKEAFCAVSLTGSSDMKKREASTIEQLLRRVEQMELQPLAEKEEEYHLIANPTRGGKIVQEKTLKELGAEEWTLSNGAKVVYRPLAGQNQVSFMAYSRGGMALSDHEEIPEASLLPVLMDYYGVGDLSAAQLNKVLTAKGVVCNIAMKPWYAGIGGQAPVGELETLMQMLWLRFEQPRFDSLLHPMVINKLRQQLQERQNNPMNQIGDTLNCVLGNYNPRLLPLTSQQVQQVSLERVKKSYKKNFSYGSDFTFVFTGNIQPEILKPLMEKYIGALAERKEPLEIKKHVWPESPKRVRKEVVMPPSLPRSTVIINYTSKIDYSLEHKLYNQLMIDVLESRCMERLRMKEGATYQVMVQEMLEAIPTGKSSFMIHFDCAPGREKELTTLVSDIVAELTAGGPSDDEINKAVKKIQTKYEQEKETAAYWTTVLFSWGMNGINESNESIYRQWLEQQKKTDIHRYIKKFFAKASLTELMFQGTKG